jgi:transcriptional regulator with XRE-family HTH domain
VDFSEMLVGLLKKYHMSQRKLALNSRVSYVTINRLINGYSSRLTRETVEKLVSGLGCTTEERHELLRAAGRVPAEVESRFVEDATTARLLRQISELNADEALDVLKHLEERARQNRKNKVE